MTPPAAALVALVLAAPWASAQTAADTLTVAEARGRAAERGVPDARVTVKGVLTLHDAARRLAFVQDATGGLVLEVDEGTAALSSGQLVEASGVVAMGARGPALQHVVIRAIGRASLPSAISAGDASAFDLFDARLVSLRGVVHSINTRGTGTDLRVGTRGGHVVVPLAGVRPDGLDLDAVIVVQGVASIVREPDGTPGWREVLPAAPIRVEAPGTVDPFTAPPVRADDLATLARAVRGASRRVTLSGIVTRYRPGRSIYLRTETGPLFVEVSGEQDVATGAKVDVSGFPASDEFAAYLEEAVYRQAGAAPPPEPVATSVGELLGGRLHAELVRVSATYVSGDAGRFEHTLAMQEAGVSFNAHLLIARDDGVTGRLGPGERLQLTGICAMVAGPDGRPQSFRLLLRDGADIAVIGAPAGPVAGGVPWWAWLPLVVAAAAVAAAVWFYRQGRRREVTIRRQQAREASLKARLDDLFERSGEILIVHDRRGRLSTINHAGEQVTGYSREELRMLDPSWVVGPDYLEVVNHLLAGGADSPPRSFRTTLVPRKGARVNVDVHARVLVGDGKVVGVTAIARDQSERERLEQELRQAQKLEAVGRLATGIAHDFNNLVTVLLGYSDELIDLADEGSDLQQTAEEIRRAAERASALTQQLLAFSRRQAAAPRSVDFNAVVANMEDLVRRLLGPEIRVEFLLAPDLAQVRTDPAQVGQLVMNLVVNARDAMPAGGALTIETANVTIGADHLDAIPGPHVMLAVRDTGVGMTAEVRKRLFEPFFTTKDTGRGTGLGLSLVHAIAREYGGHIVVESEPGRGSTFRVYFPPDTEAAPQVAAAGKAAPVRGEGVVLLAEDDRSVRRLVTNELGRRGFTVLDAEDGRAALDLFREHRDEVDLLVTDIVMPRMNGVDLAAEVAKVRPELKVLFISGHPERAGVGLDAVGHVNLLMKPFTADVLAVRIKEMMGAREGP